MAKNETNDVSFSDESDVASLIKTVLNRNITKSVKEAALGRIRQLEARDGKIYFGAYNHGWSPEEIQERNRQYGRIK